MKKIYSTIHGLTKLVALIAFLSFSQNVNAQCSLACNSWIQVSLDENCQAEVTPEMLLNDQLTTCPNGVFYVELRDENGVLISSDPAIITGEYVNETIEAKVIDAVSGNSCWGFATIEDKLPPTIACVNDTIGCAEVSTYFPEVSDNCDGDPTITLLSETETVLACDPDYIKIIERTYEATDAQGLVSAPCTQTIHVRRIDLDPVIFPEDLSIGNGNPIPCDFDYPQDANGHPDPSYTGVPTLDGFPLFPNVDLSCNAITSYTDLVLPVVGGVQKIMRTWTINEWYCGGTNTVTDIQIIEILDNVGPDFTCPADYTVSTTPGTDCEALVLLPTVVVTDNCSPTVSVDITYPGGFLDNSNGGVVSLPMGVNVITYTAYDQDLNSSSCSFNITVNDNTAPTVVCDQFTVVSLSVDGTAHINAPTFDDGSYDDCTSITFSAKRMDNGVGCGVNNNTFGPTVPFCCSDIGADVMVILRVTDAAGNYNDCMVSVEVQDKLPPVITCPENMTVECNYPYDIDNLDLDFGTATAYDNCSVTLSEFSTVNIDMCGEGVINRFFTATDPNGSTTCVQTITFINTEPFDGNTDIVWPSDVTINECVDPSTIGPDNTGYPIISEDACDLVGTSYDDKIFEIVNGENACSKIIRTWTILDWCQTYPNGTYLTWSYQQTIKIINTNDPVFIGDYDYVSVCTYDADCQDGPITLGAEASDDCTVALRWFYSVDLDNDGTFDYVSPSTMGASVDASGDYPIGDHRIIYSVEDGCGNQSNMEQFFTIANCKKPTPYCINGLAIDLMPIDTDDDGEADFGMVEIWASDFDKGSYHVCGYPVIISFSADINDTGRTFDCSDFGENLVQMWATVVLPDGTLLQDYCVATLDIQDNNEVCDGTGSGTITVDLTGTIKDEMDEKFENIEVVLEGAEMTSLTDVAGVYSFADMPLGGYYDVVPSKDGDDINGVSTLDIILIQKHILGLEYLDSPYKIIASDANNDQKMSGTDIVILRKLILGLYDEFPAVNSWRFIDDSYQFLDASNPLIEEFPEVYNIPQLNSNMNIDFMAVKVGDVNNTAKASLKSNASETRSFNDLVFTADDLEFNTNDIVRIPVTAENFENILGFQFTTSFNSNTLVYAGIEAGLLDITNDNMGINTADNGIVTVSWNTLDIVQADNTEVLFTLVFNAKQDGELASELTFDSSKTTANAYDTSYEALELSLEFRSKVNGEIVAPFELYQNVPNPFNTTTSISFTLPESQMVDISIFDVSGKVIFNQQKACAKGMNAVNLDLSNVQATGILYYQVKTDNNTATRKMVVLK